MPADVGPVSRAEERRRAALAGEREGGSGSGSGLKSGQEEVEGEGEGEGVTSGQERFDAAHKMRQELIRRPFVMTHTMAGKSHGGARMRETMRHHPFEWVEQALQGLTGADVAKIMEED
jgi:hypothetical protein